MQVNDEYTVVQIQLALWDIAGLSSVAGSEGTLSHNDRVGILSVIEEVEKIQRRTGNNPIVVHCRFIIHKGYQWVGSRE